MKKKFNIYFLNIVTVQVVRAYVSELLAAYVLQIFKEGQEQTLARRCYTQIICDMFTYFGVSGIGAF